MTIALERPVLAEVLPRAVRPTATTRTVPAVVRLTLFLFVLSIFFEIPHRTIPLEVDSATGLLFLLSTLIAPTICYRRIPPALVWFAGYDLEQLEGLGRLRESRAQDRRQRTLRSHPGLLPGREYYDPPCSHRPVERTGCLPNRRCARPP